MRFNLNGSSSCGCETHDNSIQLLEPTQCADSSSLKTSSHKTKATMNLSTSSEHAFHESESSCDLERASANPQHTPHRTPPTLGRLLARSWHGESSSSRGKSSIPAPPLSTPSGLASSTGKKHSPSAAVKKKLSPLMPLTSPLRKQKQSPSILSRLSGRGSNHTHTSKSTSERSSEPQIPDLYRNARKGRWDEVVSSVPTVEDVGFVYKKDGTAALHMAVMSITGYLNNFKSGDKELKPAPMRIVEALIKMNPEMAKVKCTLNGYTPLMYACLVCDDSGDLDQAAQIVHLILRHCPSSIDVFTDDGLSPVDVHIISYSSHHPEKEDMSSLGKTSTIVLRSLLAQSPELAISRLRGDKVEGPIELLYKCNSGVFSKTLIDEIQQCQSQSDEASTVSEVTLPERRQQVVNTVKKWWIWSWTVMILKYGSLKLKKRGSRFAAVHTAAMQIGCPSAFFSLTLYAFPRQIKLPIEDKDDIQNLPLHAVCSWPCHQDYKGSSEAIVSIRKSNAISLVLEEYPLAVKTFNGRGESALELALMTGTTWEGGIRRLVKAYPKALRFKSKNTRLYPFMTAAAAAIAPAASPAPPKKSSKKSTTAKSPPSTRQDLQSLRTIYSLLRSNPKVLTLAWQD